MTSTQIRRKLEKVLGNLETLQIQAQGHDVADSLGAAKSELLRALSRLSN